LAQPSLRKRLSDTILQYIENKDMTVILLNWSESYKENSQERLLYNRVEKKTYKKLRKEKE